MRLRTISLAVTACALVALVILARCPVKSRTTNLAALVAAATAWAGALGWRWRNRPARAGIGAAPLLCGSLFLLPGRLDRDALGDDYLRRVRAMEGEWEAKW